MKVMEEIPMATVTVRRKPTYTELEAKVKELQDALFIAEKNRALREAGWDMLHKRIAELERQNRSLDVDLTYARNLTEELNEQITADSAEITELKADLDISTAEIERLRARMAEKDKTNNIAVRATSELADMVVAARTERDSARTEAEDLRLELMERECRIDELEKQVEWLRDKNEEWANVATDQKSTIINYEAVISDLQKDVAMWRTAADTNITLAKEVQDELTAMTQERDKLRTAVDEISEQSADCCANAQYWEDQAHKLEAEMKAGHAEVDTLRRQLKANEEEYHNLRKMYVELRDAANTVASHVRANTFAN